MYRHTACKKAYIQTHKYTDKPSHTFHPRTLAYKTIMRHKNKEKHSPELGIRGDEGGKKAVGISKKVLTFKAVRADWLSVRRGRCHLKDQSSLTVLSWRALISQDYFLT